MTRLKYAFLVAVAAAAALSVSRADAQYDDLGLYPADEAGVYQVGYESLESLEERNRELKAGIARYRDLYQETVRQSATSGGCCNTCCLQPANWFDPCCCGPTLAASLSGDGWRDGGDDRFGNNFGNRLALDATWNIGDSAARGHLGGAYGVYDYHGRIGGIENSLSSSEQQIFLTAGVYRRGCDCGDWTWAAAYDYFSDNHYGVTAEYVELHQARFLLGRMMNPCNEFGVWGAFGIEDDELALNGTLEVQDQVNLYWRRYWDFGGETMLYAGVAQTNLAPLPQPFFARVFPPPPPEADDDFTEFVVGLRGIAPLTCNVGLYGGFHYVIPSASGGQDINNLLRIAPSRPAAVEENWNVTFGVMWVRGCNLPVLPVADNGWLGRRALVAQTGSIE